MFGVISAYSDRWSQGRCRGAFIETKMKDIVVMEN
jgi:hypothetical protein